MTPWPGDVIAMGTALKCAGAGTGRAIQTINLAAPGRRVSVTIEHTATLTSSIRMLDKEEPPT